ncbi:MAG: MotA/TolQ/ExbB proton channel family protein [Candidatus Omnitrophica bacterium]|nr:MotA/TolQ/ExbB proton channel family protein [Candidatus Omnitrophota bacterium]MCM8770648.1 MotA/TolQ/ExbB proton channel family protein [Candidatus Omnitrophota bacterium]
MFDFIFKGGPVMIPLILGSILGLAIIIEKLIVLNRIKMDAEGFVQDIIRFIRRGDFNAALNLCYQNSQYPLPRIFKVGIEKRNLPRYDIEKLLERLGNKEIQELEKRLGGLISIIGISPLLGFLGTITGLIRAFMAWEKAGSNITVNALASGIYQAMITTAAGLSIAVPYYLIYNYLVSRIKYISYELTDYSLQLIEVLNEPKKESR